MMWDGNRRKSARLLDAESKGKTTCYTEEDVSSEEDDSCQKRRRKRVKIRPVQDLVASRNVHQLKTEVDNTHAGDAVMPSETPLPESGKLELLLSILQKKDSYNMFAEPVNPQEVKGYNDIIKEPMDFGTISVKLSAGSYRTLEEFQRDVYLVSDNAMSYNPPSSIFNRKACDIKNLAEELFDALKNEHRNFESVCSSKTSRAAKRIKNIRNSSADRSTNRMPSRAQGVAEQKLHKAEVLNPQNSALNFQFRDLDLNVALSKNGIIGTLPSINALFNHSIGTDVGGGRNVSVTDLPSSDLRREYEKVYGWSPSSSIGCRLPQVNSSWIPSFGSTCGLNSGGGPHQFQPMDGKGSTPFGINSFEQASQGLNRLRQAEIGPELPFFKPFQWQGQGRSTPTSGTSMRPINLSDIDQWLGDGRSGGGSNTGAPPASSQGLGAAETNIFPFNSPRSEGSDTGAPPASSQGCDWNLWMFRP